MKKTKSPLGKCKLSTVLPELKRIAKEFDLNLSKNREFKAAQVEMEYRHQVMSN